MKLNEHERQKVIEFLKKHYNDGLELLQRDDLPYWLNDEELKEEFIARNELLRERYEALENGEDLELNENNFNGNADFLFGIIAVSSLFCNAPSKEDFENEEDDIELNYDDSLTGIDN